MIAPVLPKNVPADASEDQMLQWVMQNIMDFSMRRGFTHRQIWRIFDAGLAAMHCLTAPMVDGYNSPFNMSS